MGVLVQSVLPKGKGRWVSPSGPSWPLSLLVSSQQSYSSSFGLNFSTRACWICGGTCS